MFQNKELIFYSPDGSGGHPKKRRGEEKPSRQALAFQRVVDLFEHLQTQGLESPDYRRRSKILPDGTKIQVLKHKSYDGKKEDLELDTFTVGIFRQPQDTTESISFELTKNGLISVRMPIGAEVELKMGKRIITEVPTKRLIEFDYLNIKPEQCSFFRESAEAWVDWIDLMQAEKVFSPPNFAIRISGSSQH